MSTFKKNQKKLANKTNTITKLFFEKLYILPIIVIILILFIDGHGNQITNSKIINRLSLLSKQYTVTQAISDDNMVINKGVITNIDKLHDFYNKATENEEAYFICSTFNSKETPVIKSVLYKNKKFYINIDESRISEDKSGIKSYTYTKMTKIDNDNTLQLKFSNNDSEFLFLNYNKTNGNID